MDPAPDEFAATLGRAAEAAERFLAGLDREPGAPPGRDDAAEGFAPGPLPEVGSGAAEAIEELVAVGIPAATRSAGPRFFHFVTGGVTPAALGADWLTSALDQNSFSWVSSPLGSRAELVASSWLKQLFELPEEWGATLTTGATMANFTALAAGRRWWGARARSRRRRRRVHGAAGAAGAELGLHPRQLREGAVDARDRS